MDLKSKEIKEGERDILMHRQTARRIDGSYLMT